MLQTPRDDAPAAMKRRSRTSGIERTVQVLDALRDRGEAMTGYELAKAINAPISTVYALIEELAARDLLIRDNGSVWLGPRLHHYGLAYARTLDLQTVATHEMQALSRKVKECVQLCGRDGDMMVVLGMVEGPGHFKVTSRVGTRVPLNWTASGRLLVGHLDHTARVGFFRDSAQPSPTGRAVTDPDALAEAAGEAFARRISVQIGESDFSVACIAAPIRDPDGACAATISVVLPEFRAEKEPERYATAVRAAAGRIEHRLGWEHAE